MEISKFTYTVYSFAHIQGPQIPSLCLQIFIYKPIIVYYELQYVDLLLLGPTLSQTMS